MPFLNPCPERVSLCDGLPSVCLLETPFLNNKGISILDNPHTWTFLHAQNVRLFATNCLLGQLRVCFRLRPLFSSIWMLSAVSPNLQAKIPDKQANNPDQQANIPDCFANIYDRRRFFTRKAIVHANWPTPKILNPGRSRYEP